MAAVWRAGLLAGWALIAGAGSAIAEVDVEARLSMGTIEVGGVVSLLVTVTDPKGTVADPQFPLPAGARAARKLALTAVQLGERPLHEPGPLPF